MQLSYWEKKFFFYHRHLIICGAGFTGLSAAIYYKRKFPGRKILVLEKSPINGGASTKNAGFACFGSASELLANLKEESEAAVFELVEKRWKGLQNLRQLLGDEAIGYTHTHGFELFPADDRNYAHCLAQLDYLNAQLKTITGENAFLTADEKINQFGFAGVQHVLENKAEGLVDTGKMYSSLLALARETGVDIFNGVQISSYAENSTGVLLETSAGSISCDLFLVANNGFAATLLPQIRTVPARAQVLLTAPIKNLPVCGAFHIEEGFYYFRNIDNRILLGGGRHLDFVTETTTDLFLNEAIQQRLEALLRTVILPHQEPVIEQRWTGIMGMGPEKGVLAKQLTDKTFCAVRLSGMGIALSTLLGKEIAALMGY